MAECEGVVGGRVHHLCQPCLNKGRRHAADVFCSTCNEFQCSDCSRVHTVYDFMKNHKLSSESECRSQPKQLKIQDSEGINLNGLDICKRHNERFKFYCEREKVLACIKCAIIDHTKCKKIIEIDTVDKGAQLNALKGKIRATIATVDQAVENLKEADTYLRHDVQTIVDKLKKSKIEFKEMFEEFVEQVTKDANLYQDKTTTDWRIRTQECEEKKKKMKSSLETIVDVEAKGTVGQQYIIEKSMAETIQHDAKDADLFCDAQRKLKVYCNFEKHIDSLKSRMMTLVNPVEFEMRYYVPKKTRLKLIASISLQKRGSEKEEPLYSGLDFLPDGRLVVADNFNGKCKVYDEELNLQSSYKLPYNAPKDVVALSNNEVAITTGKDGNIDFLQLNKADVKTVSRACKVNAQYFSISVKDDKNFVVGTIDHEKPFRLVSMSGEEKDFDNIKFPVKKYSIGKSFCTYARGQDKVVMTDTDNHNVFIYDIKTGEKVVVKDKLIKEPCDVAVGAYEHIFVCCEDTQSLVEITLAGRVLSSSQLNMSLPRYIALSKDSKKLAVSNKSYNGRLSLYKFIFE